MAGLFSIDRAAMGKFRPELARTYSGSRGYASSLRVVELLPSLLEKFREIHNTTGRHHWQR